MNPSHAEIRQFILDHFNDEDFEVFCDDYFRAAQAEFASSLSLRLKALRLIEYCQNRGLLDNLLAALHKERRQPYKERFESIITAPAVVSQAVPRNPRQVFISHAHEDAAFAHRLAGDLQQHGWMPWITPDSIHPGEKWVPAIQRGLNESAVLLVVVTPRAIASAWVNTEVEAAIELEHDKQMRLIPLLKEAGGVPILWRRYQRASFIDDYGAGLTQLMAVLEPAESQPSRQVPTKPAKVSSRRKPKLASSSKPTQVPTPDLLVIKRPFHLELVRVPAGEFLMGSDPAKDHDAQEDEQPQHRVYVSEFYISKYPITTDQYYAGWAKQLNASSNEDDRPMVDVSWQQATEFCTWLSRTTGQSFRLPTEAEWEKAARGTDGRIYPWGNEWDEKKLNSDEAGVGDTTPVGTYSPAGDSPYGVADMAGNVWEWTADWYNENEYQEHAKTSLLIKDPTGPASGTTRVLRGGSWFYTQSFARAVYRYRSSPGDRTRSYSFRVVLGAAPVP